MDDIESLVCPVCQGKNFQIKYEASYVYSYNIDLDAPGLKNTTEFLPYLYDSRTQTDAKQYLQCNVCQAQYPSHSGSIEMGFLFGRPPGGVYG